MYCFLVLCCDTSARLFTGGYTLLQGVVTPWSSSLCYKTSCMNQSNPEWLFHKGFLCTIQSHYNKAYNLL